jgi:hypothetical protein
MFEFRRVYSITKQQRFVGDRGLSGAGTSASRIGKSDLSELKF